MTLIIKKSQMKNILIFIIIFAFSFKSLAQNDEWMCFYETYSANDINSDNENIWAVSPSGITKVKISDGTVTFFHDYNSPIPERYFNSLTTDSTGNKWFCSDSGLLIKLAGEEWTIYDSLSYYLGQVTIADQIITGKNNDLWILGHNSIVRFDGNNWFKYTKENSGLPSNFIQSIYFDDGLLWAGWNNTITTFDGFNWITYSSPNNNTYAVMDIEKDSEGNVWILHDRCIEKFDGSDFTLYNDQNTNLPLVYMNSMVIDSNDVIWAGSDDLWPSVYPAGGILKFSDELWTKYDTSNSQINDYSVGNLHLDKNGKIWFSNWLGDIGKFIDSSTCVYYDLAPSKLDNNKVCQIVTSNNGNGFVGTYKPEVGGYALYQTNLTEWNPLPFYGGPHYTIAVDGMNNLWIKYDKVYRIVNNDTISIPECPFIETSEEIHGSAEKIAVNDDGTLWMDYTDKLIYYYDTLYGTSYMRSYNGIAYYNGSFWRTYNSTNSIFPSTEIYDIEIGPDKSAWVSTADGLFKFSGEDITAYYPTALPYDFIIDNNGYIWYTNNQYGLYRFNGTITEEFEHPTLGIFVSYGIPVLDIDGSIWLHSGFHVNRFNGTEWTHMFTSKTSPLSAGIVYAMDIDKKGNKWIGTWEGFVVYRDGGVILDSYNEQMPSFFSVSVYPNPSNSTITFNLNNQYKRAIITIINATGQIVYQSDHYNCSNFEIQEKLPCGTYLYRIKTDNDKLFTGKFISL